MHIILRRFPGAAPLADEGIKKVKATLIPMLQSHKGWRGYVAFPTEQGDILTCTMYRDLASAQELAEQAVAWVKENMSKLPAPEVFTGTVGAHRALDGETQNLYCVVRKADNAPSSNSQPLGENMLNSAKGMPGLAGAYIARSTDDPTKAASIWFCDSREHAMAVHESTVGYMKGHSPDVTTRLVASGEAAILAMP
ncbi:hypothetical protein [Falsiroseomonas sp. E2-1-a20]|uniref:hypothetical protein n=1 Tax=Falsiroseomonas sp. E2-1-a20 TaxID=3239300 RepID=UPI003F2A29CA